MFTNKKTYYLYLLNLLLLFGSCTGKSNKVAFAGTNNQKFDTVCVYRVITDTKTTNKPALRHVYYVDDNSNKHELHFYTHRRDYGGFLSVNTGDTVVLSSHGDFIKNLSQNRKIATQSQEIINRYTYSR